MTAATRAAYIGVASTILGSICFSAKPVIVKVVYQHHVDAMTLLTLRMLFALPFFALMSWWASRDTTPLSRGDWQIMVGLGFIGYYLGSLLDFVGLQYISAGLARLILYLHPTIVLLMSAALIKQPIRGRYVVSTMLSYLGIALVFWHGIAIGEDLGRMALGTLLVFCGAIVYSIYLIAASRVVHRIGTSRLAAHASIIATFFVCGHFAATHDIADLHRSTEVYWLVLLMAVVSTVLPQWLQAEGLRRMGATQATLVGCVGPLSTILLAHWFLGEAITAIQMAGATLVLAGVLIISLRPKTVKAGEVATS